ncbi:hypothetical protein [Flavobacterium sp.]|uniref:hypothetical protein n=1 Tax=Flavobacterium sp. TaxID=239 RepID=UPI00286C5949|nr:hypothetical protein [Flavobacterium sp.]
MKKILPFFSYLFHPIFISVFATVFYFLVSERYFIYETIFLYIIQVLIITVFIPLIFFYLLIISKKIDSIMIANVSQRKIPLLMQILLLSILSFKTFTLDVIPELFYFFLGSIFSSLLALILVFFHKKISLHMLGVSALTLFCVAGSIHFQIKEVVFVTILLLCNGLVASSRLYMKAHSSEELVLGYTIGVIPQIILLYFWL